LNHLEEKFYVYRLFRFLENNGREVLDQDLDALKRRLVDSIWETLDSVKNEMEQRKDMGKYCSDYTLVTFPTVQSACNFKDLITPEITKLLDD
jgi:hypothetical protein